MKHRHCACQTLALKSPAANHLDRLLDALYGTWEAYGLCNLLVVLNSEQWKHIIESKTVNKTRNGGVLFHFCSESRTEGWLTGPVEWP